MHWTFLATMRKDGSAVTTHGVESQVYGKAAGKWSWFTFTTPKIASQLPKRLPNTTLSLTSWSLCIGLLS